MNDRVAMMLVGLAWAGAAGCSDGDSHTRSDSGVGMDAHVEDRDTDEIGSTLKLSPGNVRVIRHRALARLQTCMDRGSA